MADLKYCAACGNTAEYHCICTIVSKSDLRKLVKEFDDGISLDELPGWFEKLQKLAGMNKESDHDT